jgi:hypothetical protein
LVADLKTLSPSKELERNVLAEALLLGVGLRVGFAEDLVRGVAVAGASPP